MLFLQRGVVVAQRGVVFRFGTISLTKIQNRDDRRCYRHTDALFIMFETFESLSMCKHVHMFLSYSENLPPEGVPLLCAFTSLVETIPSIGRNGIFPQN